MVLLAYISILVRGFRISPEEAASLKIKDSIKVRPGQDLATILGVVHNLHCLVRPTIGILSFLLTQMIEYYTPIDVPRIFLSKRKPKQSRFLATSFA